METMLHPPKTALELYKILPEGTRCQLINNQIIMSPSPKWKHQDIVAVILTALRNYVSKNSTGKVLSDVDVYFDDENVYRPDIMFIANEQSDILGEDGYIHGAPVLVIEILSPGTSKFDKKEKKNVYERYGVKEYWLIEPATLQCEGFIRVNNIFNSLAVTDKQFTIQLLNLTIELDS